MITVKVTARELSRLAYVSTGDVVVSLSDEQVDVFERSLGDGERDRLLREKIACADSARSLGP